MSAKIKHLTIFCKDPLQTAKFYENLGLMIVHQGEDPGLGTAYCVSDGYMNLTLLPTGDKRPEGFAHFGLLTDDVAATHAAGLSAGGRPRKQEEVPGRFSALEMFDPSGVIVELANRPWPGN